MADETLSGLKLFNRGKVRDIYDLGDKLLLVASDRISAFDVILPTVIPDKGKILTAMSVYWFEVMKDIIPHHLITADVEQFPAVCQPHEVAPRRPDHAGRRARRRRWSGCCRVSWWAPVRRL